MEPNQGEPNSYSIRGKPHYPSFSFIANHKKFLYLKDTMCMWLKYFYTNKIIVKINPQIYTIKIK